MTNIADGFLLIADDEPLIVEILISKLKDITKNIQTVSNGKDALNLILTGKYDAVISDINMPLMNGIEVLSEIRKNSIQIPYIILTAYGDKQNILDAIHLDATDFLEKPFNDHKIVEVVTHALTLGLAQKEMDQQIELMTHSSNLPTHEIERIKKVQKTILGLKIRNNTYKKAA